MLESPNLVQTQLQSLSIVLGVLSPPPPPHRLTGGSWLEVASEAFLRGQLAASISFYVLPLNWKQHSSLVPSAAVDGATAAPASLDSFVMGSSAASGGAPTRSVDAPRHGRDCLRRLQSLNWSRAESC